MDKKYQVFISSTYTDLIEERQAVIEAVLNAEHIPAGMEAFKVSGKSQEEIIRRWIEESDIYVLILGPRYGSKNQDGISYTQWEYNLAKELNKPMFSIVLTDEYINGMVAQGRITATSLETQLPEYKTFKKEVSGTLVHMINNIESIKLGVSDSIRQIQRDEDDKLEGWIKGHYLIELEKLRRENKELLEKLTNRQDEVISMQKELSNVKDDYIGSYKFSYVKEKLNNQVLDPTAISKALSDIENIIKKNDQYNLVVGYKIKYDNQKSDLIAIIEEDKNALEWLVYFESKLLTENLKYYSTHIGYNLMNEYVISEWFKFSLIEKETEKGSTEVTISLTENGRKFLSMLEMEEGQTK